MVDAQLVRAWLEEHGIKGCSLCGSPALQVSKDLYALLSCHRETGAPDVARGSRVVRLRCGRCGNLMLLHGHQLGAD
jgi:hypothetical protein